MADLIDRVAHFEPRPKINLHRWIGAQRLYALGEWTRAQIGAEFGVIGFPDEERQATQIADVIDAQSNATQKMIYILRVEAVLMCVSDSDDRLYHTDAVTPNKAQIFADLLIAG